MGQYMGETVTKTRNFLVNNLDNGVIFIDEAYAITPWEDGKPESYGTEATTVSGIHDSVSGSVLCHNGWV